MLTLRLAIRVPVINGILFELIAVGIWKRQLASAQAANIVTRGVWKQITDTRTLAPLREAFQIEVLGSAALFRCGVRADSRI